MFYETRMRESRSLLASGNIRVSTVLYNMLISYASTISTTMVMDKRRLLTANEY